MRIRWDEAKRQLVLSNRGIDFSQLDELLNWSYVEDQRNDDPEQYRIVGFAGGATHHIYRRISSRYARRIHLGGHSLAFH